MISKYLTMIKYQIIVSFKHNINYKLNLISEGALFTATYFGLIFFNTNLQHDITMFIIGFIFWSIGVIALGSSSSLIESNAKNGLLELKMQSEFPIVFINFIVTLIIIMTRLVTLLILITLTFVMFKEQFGNILPVMFSFIIAIPAIFGMFGIGLIFGGITIAEKSVGSFLMIFQGVLLFLGNTTRPMIYSFESLIPYVLGIEITRNLYTGETVPMQILLYIVINLLWFGVGCTVFQYFINRERKYGIFDTY